MRTYTLLLACCLLSSPGLADQSDNQLVQLFSILQQTDNPAILRNTENQIWAIWLQHPNADVEKLMQLGTQRMNSQRYAEALVVFSQIVESFPDYAEAWNKRATLYYMVGNLDASITDIEHTLKLEPRHFGALSGLGLVYLQRNELSKARQAFEELIVIHPNSPNAKQNLETVNQRLRFGVI